MAAKLTGKQEAFCDGVANGKTLRDAYRDAYDCVTAKDATINNKAHAMHLRGDIGARIDEIKGELRKKTLWTREQSVKVLVKAVKLGIEQENPTAIAAVVDRLNKMHGFDTKDEEGKVDNSITKVQIEVINASKP
tara:strand:+ start:898 stop:1302 length:405 start_codon:yes stop_codon:yes gene_type:complete